MMAPQSVGAFLGGAPVGVLKVVGLLLVINGAHLALASARERLVSLEVIYFSAGDIVWFSGSVVLIASNVFVTTGIGQVVTLAVALGVLMLGLTQVWLLAEAMGAGVPSNSTDQRADLIPASLSRGRSIVASWHAMKMSTKIWLFALNGLFLGAVLFLPEPAARLTLAAYVASGPILAAMMIWQRGLTRLLGLAHLIPWVPLVAYLGLHLTSSFGGTDVTSVAPAFHVYLVALLVAMAICLVLDVYDCWRWWRGERFRLGSRAAEMAGASANAK